MTRLVIHSRKANWKRCMMCGHPIDPVLKACDEPGSHLPCTYAGCVATEEPTYYKERSDDSG